MLNSTQEKKILQTRPFTSSCKISYSRKETIFEAKPFLWFSHISMHTLHILYIHVPMCSFRFWHRWDHLHSPEKITAGLNPKLIFPEIFTSCFDLSSLFWGSIIRIKLPYLSSHKVVGAEDVGIIASICNLKSPHFLTLPPFQNNCPFSEIISTITEKIMLSH